ncbi:hypothetical protein N7448_000960 [Penicillium atrosanguineum]|uniref:Uncharacterized protein n=1 Tax=Penicillium atrosanguineum TaxID=1132637 RepID=A0A9W9LD47_9EURO|nr:uncharacterized protein N7443_004356 [Penicillium atrosanguineum]KAJ5134018.1 hypothetical protein N7526_005383 [Penicillium atrosanguineum]KAJ5149382.1 hypothetical protein N7448_000960 [Penicillium atrosanguineum]KAJ5304696.1 hypothetical protein N7443_004356 [Penicillium atrosanguineum]KAJ5324161.1 hypothetical protein N7476_002761 [Penicillium atrosanguineum]
MARFSIFSLTIFMVLAAIALSLPTKRDSTQDLTLENAFAGLKTATQSLEGLGDKKDTNDKENEDNKAEQAAAAAAQAAKHDNDNDSAANDKKADTTDDKPSRTQKKPSSGDFVTPTATHTHHPTSQPNALGKIPIVGGLLGGTGGPL